MDQLQYRYYANTNRLSRVQDAVSASAYSVDIDNQTEIENYSYDAIGNLRKDSSEEIEEIGWTVYGKIAYVHRTANSSRPDLEFGYDASGRRISKRVIQPGGETFTDYYVHDATGNTMAVYRHSEGETLSYKLQEWMLYGSSRLGVRRSGRELSSIVPQDPQVYVQERGHKRYELSSHLGNVHAVVSDARTTICDNGTLLRYSAVVVNYTDYYAFGMSMLGREYAGNVGEEMRYGYNGQDRLQELDSHGDTYEFEYRIHDARVGRFLSVDPLYKEYPWNSTYAFAENKVIRYKELEGLETIDPMKTEQIARSLQINDSKWIEFTSTARITLIHKQYDEVTKNYLTRTFVIKKESSESDVRVNITAIENAVGYISFIKTKFPGTTVEFPFVIYPVNSHSVFKKDNGLYVTPENTIKDFNIGIENIKKDKIKNEGRSKIEIMVFLKPEATVKDKQSIEATLTSELRKNKFKGSYNFVFTETVNQNSAENILISVIDNGK
jgi:RHS repeat-associated protein